MTATPKRSAAMDAADFLQSDWQDTGDDTLALDDAISALESGQMTGPLNVDFGRGQTTLVSPGPGLLQRLKGHRMLTAIASGAADLTPARAENKPVWVDDEVSALLGAVPKPQA